MRNWVYRVSVTKTISNSAYRRQTATSIMRQTDNSLDHSHVACSHPPPTGKTQENITGGTKRLWVTKEVARQLQQTAPSSRSLTTVILLKRVTLNCLVYVDFEQRCSCSVANVITGAWPSRKRHCRLLAYSVNPFLEFCSQYLLYFSTVVLVFYCKVSKILLKIKEKFFQ